MATRPRSRADRLFTALLRALPSEFRGDYGREMTQVFHAQHDEARSEGTAVTMLRLWLETLQDLVATAPREHFAILKQDVGYALRTLRGAPAFSIAAVATLALGIGATTGLITVLNALLFRPLPVVHPEELASVATLDHHIELPHGLSYRDLQDYRQDNAAFSDLIGYEPTGVALTADGGSERIAVELVTGNYFSGLGVAPALGRLITPAEGRAAGDAPVMVLAYDYWRVRFAGDPAVVGRSVRVSGHPVTIVGVAARTFDSTEPLLKISAYLPISMSDIIDPPTTREHSTLEARDQHGMRVLGRLRPGVSLDQARAAMTVKTAALARQYPDTNKDVSLLIVPETSARPEPSTGPWFRVAAGVFTLLAALLLTITSANIANMLLARAAARGREVAIRSAIGARRGRLVRQLLTEGVVLAAIGGALAIPTASIISGAFVRGVNGFAGEIPLRIDLGFDWRVLTAAALVACASGLLAGLAPAVYAFRADTNALLKTGGRTHAASVDRSVVRRTLIVGQVAVSLALLVTGGLFMKSLERARHLDLGFRQDHLLLADTQPAMNGYDTTQRLAFYRRARERVAGMSQTQSAAWISTPPFASDLSDAKVFVEGRPEASTGGAPISFLVRVSPEYFATAAVPIVSGRGFTDRDDDAHPQVMMVNQTLARQLWPGEDPIGRRARLAKDGPLVEIVGVVRDGKYIFVWETPRPMIFRPLDQETPGSATLIVRTAGSPTDVAGEIRSQIRATDPDVLVTGMRSMTAHLDQGNAFVIFRMAAILSGFFGLMGLLLASVGLYGVIAYHVAQREHEIGVRVALGARPADIIRQVLARAVRLAAVGAAVGILLTAPVARLVGPLLLGVSPFDPQTYGGVTLVLVSVAIAASLVPALRAVSVDPVECLRAE
jgi:putative ABC transport system permease protein